MSKRKIIDAKRMADEDVTDEYVLNYYISEKETKIIDLIYRFRMIDTDMIQAATGYSYNRLTSTLRKLYLGRFIDRKRRPLSMRMEKKGTERSYIVYHMLDVAGAIFIRNYYGLDNLTQVKWERRENQLRWDNVQHALQISSTYATLEEKIRSKTTELYLGNENDSIVTAFTDKHLYTQYHYQGKKRHFYPDLLIKYYHDKKMYGFLFEIDRGTMAMQGSISTSSFDKKVHYYEEYAEVANEFYGFSKMPTIIVLTTNKARAEGLAKAVKAKQKEINKHNVTFLFTTQAMWEHNPYAEIFIDQNFEENRKIKKFIM